ncbi:YgfZ/GcvT domain-containing protein [Pollutimonas sp. M17]|uniref:CAF17-like 4Fe-4S cluster assembly/insertion protein YgfZ n=1 Tax=Pollutimonas sp. M17 TaxID=2962065 RepID=UPI0021F44E28|nr:folate-binding protein [Pollutimonas sp. M17]UYO95380.1 folate-binding protein [Pollutimonas sp. M17]
MNDSKRFVATLSDLAVIEVTGADAVDFLHGQLTHDVQGLEPGQARLAGYCTAKGRLLGSMVIWRQTGTQDPAVLALVKADIAEALVKRLSMFVLRAKARLRLTDYRVLGLALDGDSPLSGTDPAGALSAPLASALPWTVVDDAAGTWIAAPSTDPGLRRWWFVARQPDPQAGASRDDNGRWQAGDILAGLPWVQAATQDLFIPQTLNLDLIDGVSFTKGCYPGQEVVARSHYRGMVKRRMAGGLIAPADGLNAEALAATDTFDARRPDNPCGRIVNAALDQAGMRVLMEVQLADLDGADFRLGQADGPAIRLEPLPYGIESGV